MKRTYFIFLVVLFLQLPSLKNYAQQDSTRSNRPARPERAAGQNRPGQTRGVEARAQRATNDSLEEAKTMKRKLDYIARRLGLTSLEDSLFRPVYKEYSKKLKELKTKTRQPLLKIQLDSVDLGNKELLKMADDELTLRAEEQELLKKYHEKFKNVVAPVKISKLYLTEEEYIEEQIKRNIRKEEKLQKRQSTTTK